MTTIADALVELAARSPGSLDGALAIQQPKLKRLRPGGTREPVGLIYSDSRSEQGKPSELLVAFLPQ